MSVDDPRRGGRGPDGQAERQGERASGRGAGRIIEEAPRLGLKWRLWAEGGATRIAATSASLL